MKIICKLPLSKHYRVLSQDNGKYIWQDKVSSLLRVIAPDSHPWGKEWLMLASIQKTKNDTAQYPTRLDLKCIQMANADQPCQPLIREIMRGKFVYPRSPVQMFFAFPIESDARTATQNLNQWWLLYYFSFSSS